MTRQEMIDELFENIGWDKMHFVVITDGEDTWCQFMGDQTGIDVNDEVNREIGRIPLEHAYWDDTLAEWGVSSTDEMDEDVAKDFKNDILDYEISEIL